MFDELLAKSVVEGEAATAAVTGGVLTQPPGTELAAMIDAASSMPDDTELVPVVITKMSQEKTLPWW